MGTTAGSVQAELPWGIFLEPVGGMGRTVAQNPAGAAHRVPGQRGSVLCQCVQTNTVMQPQFMGTACHVTPASNAFLWELQF